MRNALICTLLLFSALASAQTVGQGFQLNRHEPTPAGQWSFMVENPWYSSTRYFAGGVTFNYAHNPLVYRLAGTAGVTPVIAHQLLGHVDVAGSFLDRFTLNASLPIALFEGGAASNAIAPIGAASFGDVRLGVMARLLGHAERDVVSLHLGVNVWAPFGQYAAHQGDNGVRLMPKFVVAGGVGRIRYSGNLAFYYRPQSSIGVDPPGSGNRAGSELQLGAQLAYFDPRHFQVGLEGLISTMVIGGAPFARNDTSAELLLGAHYEIAKQVLVGAAVGPGLMHQAGTPDVRVLLRVAYAPQKEDAQPKPVDADGDGVVDADDRCPREPEDKDGVEDIDGCPDLDNDHDGIADANDRCVSDAEDRDGFEDSDGCPEKDNDKDGVADSADKCPNEAGPKELLGCADSDHDGVANADDQCPNESGTKFRAGCPEPEPVVKAEPQPLVQIRGGELAISQSVAFETGKDVIDAQSFSVLDGVAELLKAHPEVSKVRVEGHTDARGSLVANTDLSKRRAKAVVKYLVERGVAKQRLESEGYGPTKPIADNATEEGRSKNRRVVFTIVGAKER